jgi:hypothetical protein
LYNPYHTLSYLHCVHALCSLYSVDSNCIHPFCRLLVIFLIYYLSVIQVSQIFTSTTFFRCLSDYLSIMSVLSVVCLFIRLSLSYVALVVLPSPPFTCTLHSAALFALLPLTVPSVPVKNPVIYYSVSLHYLPPCVYFSLVHSLLNCMSIVCLNTTCDLQFLQCSTVLKKPCM